MTASIQQIDLKRSLNANGLFYAVTVLLQCFLSPDWSGSKTLSASSPRPSTNASETFKQWFKTKTDLVYLQHCQPKATTVAVTFDPAAVCKCIPFSRWSCLPLSQAFLWDSSEMSQLRSRDMRASTSAGARPLASPCKAQRPPLPVSPSDSCSVVVGFFFH